MPSIKITVDNSKAILKATDEAVIRALTAVGQDCEGFAKGLCPVDTGLLRNSITYAVGGKAPAVTSYESNASHASTKATKKAGTAGSAIEPKKTGSYQGTAPEGKVVYIGTNVEYAPYVHEGSQQASGKKTPPRRFLKRALFDHKDRYKEMIETFLKGAMT